MKPIVFINTGTTTILQLDAVVTQLRAEGYIVVQYRGTKPEVYPEENAVELPDRHTA